MPQIWDIKYIFESWFYIYEKKRNQITGDDVLILKPFKHLDPESRKCASF